MRRAAVVVVAGTVLAVAVGSYVLSSVLLDPHRGVEGSSAKVTALGNGTVTLERTTAIARPGTYGLTWSGGAAVIGAVTASDAKSVTRQLVGPATGLTPGTKVGINSNVWTSDPKSALMIDFTEVNVPSELGPMPAWQVAGAGTTWVIFVHGLDGSRQGGLRPLSTLHAANLPTLLISYRNDPGAPASSDGLIHLGMTEWTDLQAAAQYAVGQGAQQLLLYGDSMGGSIVTRFMHESPLSSRAVGIVLDAPVLDWSSVISGQASRFYVPFIALPVKGVITARTSVSFAALDEVAQASTFHVPMLIFQGLDDPLVSPATTSAFAAGVPQGLARYVPVSGAGHIQSWNVDSPAYESKLSAFLTQVRGQ